MKKPIFTFGILFFLHTSFAQVAGSYQKKLDSVSNLVIHYFQTKKTDSIYAMAGKDFKNQLSQENFKSITENQLFPLTDFKNVSFIKAINNINKYKVAGSPTLQLLIGLDAEDKIQTLLVQPFSDN